MSCRYSVQVPSENLHQILSELQRGQRTLDETVRMLQRAPLEDLGFATVDTHRALRNGFPEVIFAQGKTPEQVCSIAESLLAANGRVLVTRLQDSQAVALLQRFPQAAHHISARCLTIETGARPLPRGGEIAVVCAGTSDLPVAEEAAVTAEIMGNRVVRITDVGVAGLHRLLARLDEIQKASVVIVVAGMEGALPSVIAGLVSHPVIAVPTSIGYGANFGGLAALLGMLNSCGSGVTVVNIDNGFGAGYAASQINRLASPLPLEARS